ncbi:hypothetical protein BJY00DRAFT_315767 [Aspergillus carlsbadensis]|nr:hypothetical protein BJY00DRAFT_315767 [Aspergillus carlsbadensis]
MQIHVVEEVIHPTPPHLLPPPLPRPNRPEKTPKRRARGRFLIREQPDLVAAYELALSRECQPERPSASADEGMRRFIKQQLKRIQDAQLTITIGGNRLSIKEQGRRAIHAILSVKDSISLVITTEPHAAIAWAGVLLLLGPIARSFTQEEDSIDGFERIAGLLVRYRVIECTHIEAASGQSAPSSTQPIEKLEETIRDDVIQLYSLVLEYQMRLLKHFSRSGFFRWMEDVRVTDDWKEMLQNILEMESCIDKHLRALRGHILVKIESEVARLGEQLTTAHGTIVEARDEARAAKEAQLLDSLPIAKHAAFDSAEDQHKARCLQGTQLKTLAQIQRWMESPDGETIYWLKGMAGTGKSTISRTVAASCHDQTPLFSGATRKSDGNTCLGASFFFDRTKPERNNANALVSTICRQIATTIPQIRDDVCDAILNHHSIGTSSLNSQWECLVLGPLQALDRCSLVPLTLITVIDALDECGGEADLLAFLQLIAQPSSLSSICLKFFITSRPERAMRTGVGAIPGASFFEQELLKVPSAGTMPSGEMDDITRYLEHELVKVAPRQAIVTWPGQARIGKLATRSDGLFIYAATACRFLRGAKGHEDRLDLRLRMILDNEVAKDSPQEELDAIYTAILQFSVTGNALDEEKEMICQQFRLVVGSIVVLFEPLTTPALGCLLGQSGSTVDETLEELYSVLDSGRGVLPIRLLHLSFRDFLVTPARCTDKGFLVLEKQAHAALFRYCLDLLKGLKKNICRFPSYKVLAEEVEPSKLVVYLPAGTQYACRYWADHLQQAGMEIRDEDETHAFVKRYLLYWFEALSLMRKFDDGISVILRLSTYLSSMPNASALGALLQDTKRFIRKFKPVIETAPLQVYTTALIYSPKESLIRQQFHSEIPRWIRRMPEVPAQWDFLVQTLSDSRTSRDLALSADGKLVGSSTGRVWDTQTGGLLRVFDPLFKGYRVAFSLDAQAFMSISVEGHVKVWDMTSGLLFHEVRTSLIIPSTTLSLPNTRHPGTVKHLFSPDRSVAVIAFDAMAFEILDLENGRSLGVITGPIGRLSCIGLSATGTLLAAGSDDGVVRLWDLRAGVLQCELCGDSAAVWGVVFSTDDTLLASISEDKSVRAWDLRTREQLAALHGDFSDVAFLPNSGRLLCSAGSTRPSQLWDVLSNEHTTFERLRITGIRLSPDGTLVTAIQGPWSEKWDVGIWSSATGERVHELQGHPLDIYNAFFSDDNKLLASVSHDKRIRLVTVPAKPRIQGPGYSSEKPVKFIPSPDSRPAASLSPGDSVQLWDVATGSVRQRLKCSPMCPAPPLFAPDGRWFLVPYGRKVDVWNVTTRELVRSIDCYSRRICALALSPDGSTLAVGYSNRISDAQGEATGDADEDEIRLFGSREPHSTTPTTAPPAVGLWDLTTGALLHVIKGTREDTERLAFSPDGRAVAFTSHCKDPTNGGLIAVWTAQRGTQIFLGDPSHSLCILEWSSDGKLLAAMVLDNSWDSLIQVWDVASRTSRSIRLDAMARYLAFAPDGNRLLADLDLGLYQLWDVTTGALLGQRDNVPRPTYLRFSEDGETIETGVHRLAVASLYPDWNLSDSTELCVFEDWIRRGNSAVYLNHDPIACAAVTGDVVIVGHESGRVSFLEIAES